MYLPNGLGSFEVDVATDGHHETDDGNQCFDGHGFTPFVVFGFLPSSDLGKKVAEARKK